MRLPGAEREATAASVARMASRGRYGVTPSHSQNVGADASCLAFSSGYAANLSGIKQFEQDLIDGTV